MESRLYRTGEFARKAAVSARTLRFYDREGLLPPTRRSDAGYRLYSDEDLAALQQILALKFLGFELGEIRMLMGHGPERLVEALGKQRAMMEDRRAQLDAIIAAIDRAQALLRRGAGDWEPIARVIEVIQMEKKDDWVRQYFTPEQQRTMAELREGAYSDEAKRKMAAWPEWTEEDQQRVDAQYAELARDLERLVAAGADPASAEAQALARRQSELLSAFTRGDPDIEAGLADFWQGFAELPPEQRPPALPWNEEEGEFLGRATAIYRERNTADGDG